ncbi:hypothetical protein [Elizabethkingia ursingii]|jgi:hypothetical protein|uniref:Fibrobacter succinogenes major paralogous domain-containing protein n=1 Tax=Elizabethkingia ursingii TaxID=1756150 RepID=A0AAJ3NCG3_9FLAO|nr:hypothetical protein [Elizabethkingia ursingii]AQX09705.1 hypothetical protein BBD34_14125 [Elizabethkingia ursingii]OPB75437.1 hypothetical protein BAY32_07875 [Elizabethkingia ursingii]
MKSITFVSLSVIFLSLGLSCRGIDFETTKETQVVEQNSIALHYLSISTNASTKKHCTAYVAPGVSKIFDCYNMGAERGVDAFDIQSSGVRLFGNDFMPSDPKICNPGFRLPTKKELEGLIKYNATEFVGNSKKYNASDISAVYILDENENRTMMLPITKFIEDANGKLIPFDNYIGNDDGYESSHLIFSPYINGVESLTMRAHVRCIKI